MNLTRVWWALGVLLVAAAVVVCLIPSAEIPAEFELSDKVSHLIGHGTPALYFAGLVPRKSWKTAQVSAALSAIIGAVLCIPLFVTLARIGGLRLISPLSVVMFPQHYLYVRIGTHFITFTTALWLFLLVFAGALIHILVSQGRENVDMPPTRFSSRVS